MAHKIAIGDVQPGLSTIMLALMASLGERYTVACLGSDIPLGHDYHSVGPDEQRDRAAKKPAITRPAVTGWRKGGSANMPRTTRDTVSSASIVPRGDRRCCA